MCMSRQMTVALPYASLCIVIGTRLPDIATSTGGSAPFLPPEGGRVGSCFDAYSALWVL